MSGNPICPECLGRGTVCVWRARGPHYCRDYQKHFQPIAEATVELVSLDAPFDAPELG